MNDKVILLVEDSRDDETLIKRALTKYRVADKVLVAHDGEEAIDCLFNSSAQLPGKKCQPSLVLLDLKLPKIDGLEILRRIRDDNRTRLLPVVVLTSSDEEGDLIGSYDLGANSYVRKPIDFDEFIETVRQVGTYWLSFNLTPDQYGSTT